MKPLPGTENDVDEIIPKLYLGNEKASYDLNFLKQYNIKYVIRMMPEYDKIREYPGIVYFHIPIRDSKTCPNNVNYTQMFQQLTQLLDYLLKQPGNTLIHCKRGHHRSASVVAAYLIKYKGFSYIQSINYIKKFRPYALRKTTCIMNELYKYCLSHVR